MDRDLFQQDSGRSRPGRNIAPARLAATAQELCGFGFDGPLTVHHFNTIPFYIETGWLQPPGTRVHSLLYVSMPVALRSPSQMALIIAVAHDDNPRESIARLLLWSEARFAQILEEPGAAVGAIVARIRPQVRPHDVRPVARCARSEPRFAGSSLTLARLFERDCWRLLQRRTSPKDHVPGSWLSSLMLSETSAAPMA
jgi:hypothetical protein